MLKDVNQGRQAYGGKEGDSQCVKLAEGVRRCPAVLVHRLAIVKPEGLAGSCEQQS